MNKESIQQTINELHYWDAAVISLECNYFADEVTLVYDDELGNVIYSFKGCYKTLFNHAIGYVKDKPTKELTFAQYPYFLQNVVVDEVEDEQKLFVCTLLLPPLEVEIWCKNINVSRQNNHLQ